MDTKHFKILQEMTSCYAKIVLQCKYWRIELSELKGLKRTRFLRLCDVESIKKTLTSFIYIIKTLFKQL